MTAGITKRIGSIKFSCTSPEEIRKMSAVKVFTADTYRDDDMPLENGLMDRHMGVTEPGLRCQTCGCKVDECPGHFGHIDLAMPVIHVGFVKDIKMLLESTCDNCGRLLLAEDEIKGARDALEDMGTYGRDSKDKRNYSKKTAKTAAGKAICPYCGTEQKKIILDKPSVFRLGDGSNHKLTPKEVRERLELITDDDLRALGYNPETCRPEWMVLTVLAVPPVTVRPSITMDSGEKSEDDLTHKLVDVLKINQRLRENRDSGSPQLIIEDQWDLLQYHVTTYFDNQTSGTPPAKHRSGRSLKTLSQRLKGKEGRFRSNLSGKRVNFSARTVISPDPLLSINEVGVPVIAARELTVPMHVNHHNIEKMREFVRRGPEPEGDTYIPGVNYVIRADGRRIRVTDNNKDTVAEGLDIDYVVERHLIDGDIVLFNRQPSLHRMSMMGHRVRIMSGRTFRFNLCDCPPYNADFDGDEMNLHVLQSDEARAEARILMQVQENILSPRYGGPIIGAIHDHITGSYFLTHGDQHFDRFEAMNIMFKLADERDPMGVKIPEPAVDDKGNEYWTGKQLFSTVLPDNMNITFKANICQNCDKCERENCHYDAYVRIRDGKLECGTIDVKAIGNSKGKILDRIARDYGSDRAAKFINQVTRLALGAIMNHGFSTGIGDEDIPDEAANQIKSYIDERIDDVSKLVQSYEEGTLEQTPGRSLRETLENKIKDKLSNARDEAGRITGQHLGMLNPAVIMAKAGARGNMLNLSQMAGCVGQQSVRGERLTRGYGGRTLPHFQKNDYGAYARGFCSNSYKSGLSPTEFFFHAMGGREGLVDTAVRTSRSGYMQRRLVAALEDLKIMDDGTVRNTAGTIIQFKYGEDGADPSRTVGGNVLDIGDLLFSVFGDSVENVISDGSDGGDYGSVEKDEIGYSDDEPMEDPDSDDFDFDSEEEGE